ncbi:MAG: hypothetical protein A2049_03320 [Elusimicrobia bacterium GWA2_62_23]|nr:MAG: hypothetical protein A2049_03320 [Elusimicrobia bacterium GWA2_62_23]
MGKYYPPENWGRAKNGTAEQDAVINGAHWSVSSAERAAVILPLAGKGSILDVGCGDGFFLLYLSRLGWDCHGVEPGETAAAYARETLGLDVRTGTLLTTRYEEASFDVVSFHHVFEHLREPKATLREVRKLLKAGGYLVVSVPNFDSVDRKLFGSGWVGLKLPQHLFQYTSATLRRMLEDAGFAFCSVAYRSYEAKSTMYYSESLRYCLRDIGLYPPAPPVNAPTAPPVPASSDWRGVLHFFERGLFKGIGCVADALHIGSTMTMVMRNVKGL